MAGELLHLIRDAEKKAEKIEQEATVESKAVLIRAKETAKRLLQDSTTTKQVDDVNIQSEIQNQISDQKEQLTSKFREKEEDLKENAVKNRQEAVETVLKMVLES
ncbi:hypothetical protein CEE45_15655 [Candidatus Heimdallarchaeota archaeon B3_Heim]|nr:MAG: hypothetical protein CEE45_15655 [Candidatus Heimdallarchaeota archaeon B3_Heim]